MDDKYRREKEILREENGRLETIALRAVGRKRTLGLSSRRGERLKQTGEIWRYKRLSSFIGETRANVPETEKGQWDDFGKIHERHAIGAEANLFELPSCRYF